MKIFKVYENEDYKHWVVAAEDIIKAIDLFKKATDSTPVKIKDITGEEDQIIVEGLIEPEYLDLPF